MSSSDFPQWTRESSEEGPDLKLFKVRFDYMKNPRNSKIIKMVVLESQDSVNVLAFTPDEKIIMVRQYRFGIGGFTLELPGGLVDPGEDMMVAAQRELLEETGYSGTDWQFLGSIQSNPVFMDSYLHHLVAKGVKRTSDLILDDGEDIEVVFMTLEEIKAAISKGEIAHPHVISALSRYYPNLWTSI